MSFFRPEGCTCGRTIYERGCGFGHLDDSLCETCERYWEATEREELNEAHADPFAALTMDEALALEGPKV